MKRINGYGQVFRIFNQGVFSVLLFVVFSLMFLPPVGLPGARVPLLLWAAQETSLEPGKPIERELSLRQFHDYQLSLLSGQFLRLTIEPQAADVALELKNPAGQKVLDANLTGVGGQERLSYLSPADGTYRLKVVSLSGGKMVGTYRLNLTLRQQASAQEQNLIAAERLLTEAGAMAETPATSAQAIQKAEQALAFWREVGDPYWEAYSLNLLAAAWSAQAKHETALALAEEAMALARRQKDRVNEAQALYYSGNAQRLLSRTQPARDSFAQALAISRELGDRWNEGRGLLQFGIVQRLLGDRGKALTHYEQALAINREVNDRVGEARTLNSLGIYYQQAEQPEKAAEIYEQGLSLSREVKDRVMEARLLNNLAMLYDRTGRFEDVLRVSEQALALYRANQDRAGEGRVLSTVAYAWLFSGYHQKAIDLGLQALSIHREFKAVQSEATTLHNLGNAHIRLNQFEQAAEYYQQSLAIKREINDRTGTLRSLLGLGNALAAAGKPEEAWPILNEALPLTRELKDRRLEANALVSLGQAMDRQRRSAQAVEYYTQALALHRDIRDRSEESRTLEMIGNAYLGLHQWAEALKFLEQGQAINREVSDRETELLLLYGIGLAEMGRENNDRAREYLEQALRLAESLRSQFFNQALRTSFFSTGQDIYATYVALLMRLHEQRPTEGFDTLALQANERGRVRNLLEQLAENRQDIRRGVAPALIESLNALQRSLNIKAARREILAADAQNSAQLANLDKEIAELVREQEQVQAQIRSQSPRYAALTQPTPLTAREIQNLLDANTVLLEYALDEKQSWLWLLTPTALKTYRLPPRAEIEAAATEFHRLLAQPAPNAASQNKLQAQARTLSRMLLGPVATQLDQKRLLIVAPGALQYLPFAALTKPGPTGKNSGAKSNGPLPLLIAEHEIVNLPSASTLAVLRNEMTERRATTKTIAVLADPVFSSDDPRVKAANSASLPGPAIKPGDFSSPIKQSLRDFRGQLERLFYSRDEAEAICAAAPAGESFQALDFRASYQTATSADLANYRIVHFATHGLLNAGHPELSGLALSLVDEKGQPQDGFLRLHEIYNLKLNADLVVLSACQTALGKEIKGEGLIGLTRGFMYAGAPRVVASLWKVDDLATAELMKRFYRAMLQGKQRPAAALRAAQLEMMQKPRWQSPFYWAAFTLQGEWK